MARHLKSIIKKRLKGVVSYYVPNAEVSASHARGVCYFVPIDSIRMLWGAMNTDKEGRRYKKHIIVRRVPRRGGHLLQLYTYRFPKTWSAACVANRELIKCAQQMAHSLEHDHSLEALEWRIRFFRHYFRVVKGGATPEPGMKRYSRFYQYTYVAIYRGLKAAQADMQAAEDAVPSLPSMTEDVSFNPVETLSLRSRRPYPLQVVMARHRDSSQDDDPFREACRCSEYLELLE